MRVFDAFRRGVIKNRYKLVKIEYSTAVGNVLKEETPLDVIEEQGATAGENNSPSAAILASQTLLYLKPEQLPTTNGARLMASYAILDGEDGQVYEITATGLGKNQETGEIEHVEINIKPNATPWARQ